MVLPLVEIYHLLSAVSSTKQEELHALERAQTKDLHTISKNLKGEELKRDLTKCGTM